MTNSSEREAARRWVEAWKRAGPRLRDLKKTELRSISTERALLNLAGAFEDCRLRFPPRPSSGLVEQQRLFSKLRK